MFSRLNPFSRIQRHDNHIHLTSKMASQRLPTRQLGKNGPQVPALGFGLMELSVAYGKAP